MSPRPAPLSLVLLATILALVPQCATAEPAAPLRAAGNVPSFESDDSTASFPVMIDPLFAQQAYVKASNTDALDQFGHSVAISGNTIVVGAPFEASSATGVNSDQSDNSAYTSGAVYVFVRSAGVWRQQAYLKASNTGGDYFGESVAISGDTLVVGAPYEDSSATGVNGDQSNNSAVDSGAVYVFVRSDGAWSQQAYLKASNTGAHDYFGLNSVAISGDTLVVGALGEDSSATGVNGNQSNNSAVDSGAAYVFVRNAGVWSQQAYLKASNTGDDDSFGWSVAISGDILVVGAEYEDSNATSVNGDESNDLAPYSGAAYVFVRSSGDWSQQAYLKASNTDEADQFGRSVAISGDTLIVGAPFEESIATGVDGDQSNNSAEYAGAAYVFVRSSGDWSQQAYLKASNTDPFDQFGSVVAISGDTLVVGAPIENSNATGVDGDQSNNSAGCSGAAYVFARNDGDWSQQAYLKASNTDPWDRFGWSVAISGGIVGAGAQVEGSSAVGVNGDQLDNSAFAAGAAYVFAPLPGINLEVAKVADIPTPPPGGTVVFTLTVTNQGPVGATGVVVTDTLPAGLTYGSNDCGATFASPTLTWTVGSLADLASASCHLTVAVDASASGAIVNTATVDGNEFDPQAGDNAADAMLSFPMDYYTLTPCRLVDTRLPDGPLGGPALAAYVPRSFVLAGACGIPADAAAVVLNVTVVKSTGGGSVQIYRAGSTPLAGGGTVHYRAGSTRAGNGIVTLGAGGAVTVLAQQPAGKVHLILDVAGYFL